MNRDVSKIFNKFSKYNITELRQDGSNRSFYRLLGKNNTMILMISHDKFSNERYINAYKKYLEQDVPIPKVLDYNLKENYLLFEDLGDQHLRQIIQKGNGNTIPYLKEAIDVILKLQFHDGKKTSIESRFDLDTFDFESNYAFFNYCEVLIHRPSLIYKYEYTLHDINQFLAKSSTFLTHRDYHPDNIMIKDGKIYIIDYQDTRLGPPTYDLVSLLYDRSNLTLDVVEELKEYYFNQIQKYIQFTEKEFQYLFSVNSIQRLFKILGSFAYLSKTKHNPKYLEFIPNTLVYMDYEIKKSPYRKELRNFTKELS